MPRCALLRPALGVDLAATSPLLPPSPPTLSTNDIRVLFRGIFLSLSRAPAVRIYVYSSLLSCDAPTPTLGYYLCKSSFSLSLSWMWACAYNARDFLLAQLSSLNAYRDSPEPMNPIYTCYYTHTRYNAYMLGGTVGTSHHARPLPLGFYEPCARGNNSFFKASENFLENHFVLIMNLFKFLRQLLRCTRQ